MWSLSLVSRSDVFVDCGLSEKVSKPESSARWRKLSVWRSRGCVARTYHKTLTSSALHKKVRCVALSQPAAMYRFVPWVDKIRTGSDSDRVEWSRLALNFMIPTHTCVSGHPVAIAPGSDFVDPRPGYKVASGASETRHFLCKALTSQT